MKFHFAINLKFMNECLQNMNSQTYDAIVTGTVINTIPCPNSFDAQPKWIPDRRKRISKIKYRLQIHDLSMGSNIKIYFNEILTR